jgi:hypothetical protein
MVAMLMLSKLREINDGKVMAAMINSVKQSMIMSLRKFKTVEAIWSHLQGRYVQDSGALLHTIMQQTHALQQNDMTIDEYYSAFDRLVGSLTSMIGDCTAGDCPAHKFIDTFFIYRFVMGVREEFDSIRKRLLHDSPNLTMAGALSDLIAEETHLRSMSAPPMSASHSVLAASQKSNVPKGSYSEPCKHCGKTNHNSENCVSQHPEKLADFRVHVVLLEVVVLVLLLEAQCLLPLLHLSVLLSHLGFLIQGLLFM